MSGPRASALDAENRRLRSLLVATEAQLADERALTADLMDQVTRANEAATRAARLVGKAFRRAAA